MASSKLSAKAARLDFSSLPGGAPAAGGVGVGGAGADGDAHGGARSGAHPDADADSPAGARAGARAGVDADVGVAPGAGLGVSGFLGAGGTASSFAGGRVGAARASGTVGGFAGGGPATVGGMPLPGVVAAAQPSALESGQRPKTAPGAMMAFANDARSELVRENEQLRLRAGEAEGLRGRLDEALTDLQQWDGAKAARLLDAQLIQPSRYANRHDRNYSGLEFQQLRAEIENAGGNVQAIKVRSIAGGEAGAPAYEVVFGHRRHRACLELGLPVLAVVDNLDDRALFVEMDRENRARKDLSAWEQGMMYRRALQQGLFPSNRKLSEAIGVDLSALGKALALAELPEEVVQAFASPLELQFRWAKPLADALVRDRVAVLTLARALAKGPADRRARGVFEALSAVGLPGVEPFHPPARRDLTVGGEWVGTVATDAQQAVAINIAAGRLNGAQVASLVALVEQFLAKTGPGAA